MDQEEKQSEETKSNKGKIIIIVFTVVSLLVIVSLGIYYVIQKNNATGQVEKFESAVENNKYSDISNILSDNEYKISETQAKHFVEYIKKDGNNKKFHNEIKSIKQNIKKEKQYDTDMGTITDSNEQTIITIKKDGKKYLILDKVTFKPTLFDVYIREYNNTGIYEYNIGENIKTSTNKNSLSSIGKFFVGCYSIDTEKTVKDSLLSGKVKGQLLIDTDKRNKDNKIVIDDISDQAWFKVLVDNTQDLEEDTIKLHIGNKETEYDSKKVYGKFINSNKLSVYATGKYEDKTFKTKSVDIEKNHSQNPQSIKLDFDKAEISAYIKDTKKIKDNAKSFMTDYMKDLNKAYRKSDYTKVDKYIDSKSKLEKQVKGLVESKEKVRYYQPKFIKLTREGKQIKIIMEKQLKDREVKSEYTLKFNDKNDDFKIVDYKDL